MVRVGCQGWRGESSGDGRSECPGVVRRVEVLRRLLFLAFRWLWSGFREFLPLLISWRESSPGAVGGMDAVLSEDAAGFSGNNTVAASTGLSVAEGAVIQMAAVAISNMAARIIVPRISLSVSFTG